MENNETLIKVRNVDEIITEFTYITENLKDTLNNLLTELDNKKDVLNKLEKIETIHNELQNFKNLIDEFKKVQDDFTFLMRATNTTIKDFKDEINKFEKHYETITDILQRQTNEITVNIEDSYEKMFKKISNMIKNDFDEYLKKIKIVNEELQRIYETDYMEDVRKLKTQQKITNFLLAILIAAGAYFAYNVNKKLNYIQTTTYYNYKILYNQ